MNTNISKVAYYLYLLIIINLTTNAQDNWSWLNPKPMGSSVESCGYFPGTNTVIAVGASGLIMRSTDNGLNWSHIQSNLTSSLLSVSLTSSTTGYISGESAVLLKTTDAGVTWSTVNTGLSGTLNQIDFVDNSIGFLRQGSDINKIYKTTNGGTSWTDLPIDLSGGNLTSLNALSESEILYGNSIGKVIKSSSPTWSPSSIQTFTNDLAVASIAVNGTKVVAASEYQLLMHSTDSGTNWSSEIILSGLSIAGVEFISSTNLVAFTSNEDIRISTDGGATWSSMTTVYSQALKTAAGNLSGNGIILGLGGIQYNTLNSGADWSKTSSEPTSDLLSVCAKDANEIYVAGKSGTLLKTTNGGIDWTSIVTSNNRDITDIKFDPSNNLYFTTAYGRIYKSTDSGISWDSTALSTRSLQEISFGSTNNAVACGINNGTTRTVFCTDDAGANWTICTSATENTIFYSTYFVPTTQTAYICGSSGRVNKSTNGGQTWVAKTSAGSSTLNSAYFLDELTGFVVGNSGSIWKTLDSAHTWSQKGIGLTTANLQSVRFSDPLNGIIVGNLGTILKTTDGGTTWTKSAQITGNNLMSAALVNSTTTLVAGNSGTIIKSSNAPLPVELVSFSASVKNKKVELKWQTATEIDNYGFEIQRKTKNSDWEKIGFVEGNVTSNSPKYYDFTDIPTGTGKYSYRLKQIDNDGKFEYSGIVEVDLSGMLPKDIEIKNFPNPFNPVTNINIKLPETAETTIELYNSTGEKIYTIYKGKLEAGTTWALKLDGSNLPSGVYLIHVTAGKYRKTHKILLMK